MPRLVKIHAFGYFLCMGLHVTIIGAGLTGTAVISRLTRVLHEARRADSNEPAISGIRVIERGPDCGPGFAHSSRTAFPRHLINMCPWDMSILADNPHDFQEWLETRHEELSESFPMFRPHLDRQMTAPEPCPFVPRGVMGEYPIVNARRLKALFASGRLELRALGADYELQGEHQGPGFVLTWTEAQGSRRQERFDAVVDARGESKSFSSNQSELARNLLASKTACLEQLDLSASDSQPEAEGWDFTSGGLWIDPDTQRLKRLGPDGRTDCSQAVYAAGPPTRGQILDAGMAWSSALAAQRIVQDIMEQPPE